MPRPVLQCRPRLSSVQSGDSPPWNLDEPGYNALLAGLAAGYDATRLDGDRAAARAAISALIELRANVLMMASIAGLAAGSEACRYVTMKHGLLGLTKSIARDFGPKGLRCNAICPGWARTEMADMEMGELMARKGLATVDEAYAPVTRDVPLRRPAEAADLAAAAAFQCLDDAKMITGSILTGDGGATIVDVPTQAF